MGVQVSVFPVSGLNIEKAPLSCLLNTGSCLGHMDGFRCCLL